MNEQDLLAELKKKYQSVLSRIADEGLSLEYLHVQDGKLFIRAEAPSQEVKNRIWDRIKRVDPTYQDLVADITLPGEVLQRARTQAAGGTGIGDLLNRYIGFSGISAPPEAIDDFEQVAGQAPSETVANGLAEAFRSKETPPFPEMLGQLFGRSGGTQRAGILKSLIGAVGPSLVSKILGGTDAGHMTPEQAERISPDRVKELARHAEERNPSVIDQISAIYAQHPQLVKTLGSAALTIAMAKMAQRMFPGR